MSLRQNGGILIKGLNRIGAHIGISSNTVRSWYQHLDLPLFIHPSAKLKHGPVHWVTTDSLLQAWFLQQSIMDRIQWYILRGHEVPKPLRAVETKLREQGVHSFKLHPADKGKVFSTGKKKWEARSGHAGAPTVNEYSPTEKEESLTRGPDQPVQRVPPVDPR